MTYNENPPIPEPTALESVIAEYVHTYGGHTYGGHINNHERYVEVVLASPQMQALKQFALGAAQHAASVGMEKSMEKYLEAMGLDEITIEWVLS